MNKKGAMFHWIVFGMLGAVALLIILNLDITLKIPIKGGWAMEIMDLGNEEQLEKILIQEKIKEIADKTTQTYLDQQFALDHGCDTFNGVSYVNTPDKYCSIKIDKSLLNAIQENVKKELGLNYTLELTETELIFTTTTLKEMVREKITYYYNPSIKIDYPLSKEYTQIYLEIEMLDQDNLPLSWTLIAEDEMSSIYQINRSFNYQIAYNWQKLI